MGILDKLGFVPIRWTDDGLEILDQRLLPVREKTVVLKTVDDVAKALANLSVRGAPLIGIAAAYGLCLLEEPGDDYGFDAACDSLVKSRPTAANLAWAIKRVKSVRDKNAKSPDLKMLMLSEAAAIHRIDAEMCENIGRVGSEVVSDSFRILTHCNTGALATGGIGTALGIIFTAFLSGKRISVWVDETRPLLQGSRLTAWELAKVGIPHKIIADNMAGRLMADGRVDLVLTGADRVAANLDFANKTGTYSLAVLAKNHEIPFYAAAPSSTFDPDCPDGKSILIENRDPDELRKCGDTETAPRESPVYNPAFDITPHNLISGIITENEILRPKKKEK